jgi:hypothetical protein
MEKLNRADNGQIDDTRYEQIQDDYMKTIVPFLEKYNHIDQADLMLICSTTFNYELTKSKIRKYSKIVANEC